MKFDGEITKMSADWYVGEIDRCKPREKISLFLNTPGGEIYAGGDMVIATRKAMKERGVKFEIELGSCVASMGASLVAAVKASGGKVIAHRNTSVMFHGCYGLVVGGADELRDSARSMEIFNDSVREDLAQIGIEDTEEWFAADRQKWLSAHDMLDLGLIDSIYEDDADADADYRVVADRLAAKLNHKEETMNETIEPKAEEVKPEEAAPATEPAPEAAPEAVEETPAPEAEPTVEEPKSEEPAAEPAPAEDPKPAEDLEAKANELANERFAKLQAAHDKMLSELHTTIDNLRAELSAHITTETTLKDEIAKAKADLDEANKRIVDQSALEAEIAEMKKNHEAAIAPALAHHEPVKLSAKDIATAHMTAEQKVAALLKH